MKLLSVTTEMKATEQYFPVVLFIMLYKVVLTFESVDEILWYDHSNESYWAVISCGTVYYAVQGGSNFWVCGWNPQVWPLRWKLLSSTFLWNCLLCSTSLFQGRLLGRTVLWCRWLWSTRWSSLTFESVNKILWWNHSNKSLQAVLSHGAVQNNVYYTCTLQGGSNL